MGVHAKLGLGPSGFRRTINCAGWPNLCKQLPRPETNEYAAEGSVAHHLAEVCLSENKDPGGYEGITGWYNNGRCGLGSSDIARPAEKGKHFIFTVDAEMIEAVRIYIDHIRSVIEKYPKALTSIEEKVDLEWLAPGMFGTADFTLTVPLETLYVFDYKHGRGVVVELDEDPTKAPQAPLYALGVLGPDNPYMVEEVVCTIVQPRAPHSEGPVRTMGYDVAELYEWGQKVVKPAALAIEKPDAPVVVGDWCKFCPAAKAIGDDGRMFCPAIQDQQKASAELMFGTDSLAKADKVQRPDPTKASGPRLGRILDAIPAIEEVIKAYKEEAYRRLETNDDDKPENYKLVQGKLSNRAWANEEKVYENFKKILPRKEVIIEKVASPAQLEKALKKAGPYTSSLKVTVESLLKERVPGKPIMVPVTDKRPEYQPAEIMFKEEK